LAAKFIWPQKSITKLLFRWILFPNFVYKIIIRTILEASVCKAYSLSIKIRSWMNPALPGVCMCCYDQGTENIQENVNVKHTILS
jgi:hypothetical protein